MSEDVIVPLSQVSCGRLHQAGRAGPVGNGSAWGGAVACGSLEEAALTGASVRGGPSVQAAPRRVPPRGPETHPSFLVFHVQTIQPSNGEFKLCDFVSRI